MFLRIRNPMLYPAELHPRNQNNIIQYDALLDIGQFISHRRDLQLTGLDDDSPGFVLPARQPASWPQLPRTRILPVLA
jgi:hypothetical protein